jgi:hypothetical protein
MFHVQYKFLCKEPVRSKLVVNDQPIGQVQSFTSLGSKLTHGTEEDIDWKITRCNDIRGGQKSHERESNIRITSEIIYEVMAVHTAIL